MRQASAVKPIAMTGFWTEQDARELNRLQRECEALLSRQAGGRRIGMNGSRSAPTSSSLYTARRLREGYFPEPDALFGEPAWDMLLDLHTARARGQIVTVASASLGAQTPTTTGVRWLKLLERLGMVERSMHPTDRRAQVVTLGTDAMDRMAAYLERLSR